jgi:signal transduction histidine kinase
VYGTLAGAQRDAILRARRSIGGALNLVVDLIDIARSESKELPITDAVIDVSTLVQELAQEYRAQAEAKGLRLTSAVAPDLPTVCGDDRRIHQILANFLSNAVKYTVEGSIWLTADLDVGPGGKPAIIFGVRDSGPGIPAADIPTLFREFRRLAPERAEGAGIGLAISKRLADALGGRIAVSSKPGVGSHFTLTLPAGTDN